MALIKAVGCAFNIDEMFMNFPYEKLKITCDQCLKINKNLHRDKLVKKIFRSCYKKVLEDVIDNNVTFQLPTKARKSDIHMIKTTDEAFRDLRKGGKWSDVNLIDSNFTGYQLGLYMYGVREVQVKPIYVNKKLKDKITRNTNEGKQYC